jgi:hypothetical protein
MRRPPPRSGPLEADRPWITADNELVLKPGMCLAVERRIAEPDGLGAQWRDPDSNRDTTIFSRRERRGAVDKRPAKARDSDGATGDL